MLSFWMLFCVLFTLTLSYMPKNTRLHVAIYYESKCPNSAILIKHHLYPNIEILDDLIELELIPFGNSIFQNSPFGTDLICQHGPSECIGNTYQACILNQSKGQKQAVKVINCIMSSTDPSNYLMVQTCVNLHNYNMCDISTCMLSGQGNNLLYQYGQKTRQARITSVPTIIIDREIRYESGMFLQIICDNLRTTPLPSICNSANINAQPIYQVC